MRSLEWEILQGAKVPEGFQGAYGVTVALPNATNFFAIPVDTQFYFLLERITARFAAVSSDNYPKLSLFRTSGQVSFFGNTSVDLRNLTNPAENPTSDPEGMAFPGEPLGILFVPGELIQGIIDGITAGDPANVKLCFIGRFIRRQEKDGI